MVADPRLEVVDLKSEVPERRSGGIRPNLTPAEYKIAIKQPNKQVQEISSRDMDYVTICIKINTCNGNICAIPDLYSERFMTTAAVTVMP